VITLIHCFDSVTTTNAKSIKLRGAVPLGGTWSGPGVNSTTGVFSSYSAGVGIKTITYTYTNAEVCTASRTKTIRVQSPAGFFCGNKLTDIRDGKKYTTVLIGSQCWFAENLNFGSEILENLHQRDNCIAEKYISAVGSRQSTVYQWDELMKYDDTPGLQGLCPPAWHVPTESEWNTLFSFYAGNGYAGSALKSTGYSGFNALLPGVSHLNRQWDYSGFATLFWSSASYGTDKAWAHGMNVTNPSVSAYPSARSNGFSVRCIRD
jgi:uncharacterized protein (TIGR02145 family)